MTTVAIGVGGAAVEAPGSAVGNAFAFLQKVGKALMLPVAVLPVAGLLLGIGAANFAWLPPIVSETLPVEFSNSR